MKTLLARMPLLTGLFLCSHFPASAGNQILLRNLLSADGNPQILAAGGTGALFAVSTLTSASGQQISRVVKLDLNGARVASLDLAQMQSPAAAAADGQGNLIVVGLDQAYQGLVLKLDSQLLNALTVISLPAALHAVATDGAGNIYLTGSTSSATFPVTAGAYRTTPPYTDFHGSAAYAFVTEISPAGQVLYSTYFGSDTTVCFGGSYCIGKFGVTSGTAIALDASGTVTIAGTTTATGLPVTPGALEPVCVCGYDYDYGPSNAGFAARFRPGGAPQLQWSTFLNASSGFVSVTMNGMALDSSGNVILGGSAPHGLPSTAGAFQIPAAGTDPNGGAFLLELNSAGTAAIWGTYFGSEESAVQAVRVDPKGRVVFSGYLEDAGRPGLLNRPTYVGRATGDGQTLTDFYAGPETLSPPGPALTDTPAGFASMFQAGALWIETAAPGPSLLDIANSASGLYSASVEGTEPVTLYGVGIGPATPLGGQIRNGAFTSSLGGCQVLFDGVAAPLLYADSGQINAVAPRLTGQSPHITVVTPAGTIDGPTVALSNVAVPGIFENSQTGLAAALNQDGSINSPSNPARSGSIVTIFVTAYSRNYFPDGTVVPLAIYDAATAVWVLDSSRSLEVVFAGDAPGMVAGVMQINFRLPDPLPAGNTFAFWVEIGGIPAATAQSQIAMAP